MKKTFLAVWLAACAFIATAQTITGKYEIPTMPDWAKNAVFYQIYPQTFCDSDGDGIGDLQGIISKLDYVKSLGVDAIWFNPFFDSPFNDAGYDIRDYYKIAPRYGTNDDAKRLFEEAHKRGMHVIFDYVISYTAIDHPWFVASQKQEKNKYSNYYIWTETNWVDPPQEFAGQFVKGYGQRNGQFMRNFYWCQPALNFGFANPDPEQKWQLPTDHPDVMAMREDLKNVLRFWMDMGADGFRADMAGALVKTRRVRGNEQFYNTNENETKLFWREIRQLLEKEYPQQILQNAQSIHIKCPMREIDNHFENEVMHNDSSDEQIVVKLKDYNWCKAHSNQLSYILGMVIIVILIISGATIGARYYVEQREMAQLKADSIESIRKARLEKAINEITNRMDSLDRHFNRESEKLFNAVKGRKGKEK